MDHLPSDVLALSLQSAALELSYNTSKHNIELLSKDEDIRRLRAEIFLVEDDAEELRDQLHHEQESSERIKQLVDQHLVRAQVAEEALETGQQEHRKRDHEIGRLQTELQSLKDTTQDANTILTEKLALARELSVIRPELEHLRAQDSLTERLRSEKLSLQRELADAQCEIESARADAKRALAKRRNTTMEIAQEEQVADLRKELARERRLRANAEELVKQTQNDTKTDESKKELLKERKLREKLEQEVEDLRGSTELEEVRRELSRAQKAKLRLQEDLERVQARLEESKSVTKTAALPPNESAIKEAQTLLEREKELRLEIERNAKSREDQLELEKAQLEDKLNQFRSKLREKKDELKSTKEELEAMKEKAETSAKVAADLAPVRDLIKKTAASKRVVQTKPAADETMLGTPGDGPKTKRGRQAKAAAVGEKSSFSITPFLNKTSVLNPEQADSPMPDASPSIGKQPGRVPLSPAASIRSNRAPKRAGNIADKEELDAVVEVEEPVSQKPLKEVAVDQITNVQPSVESTKPATKRKQKPRKSLTDFKTFQREDEPVKQKKRRLGLAPTLFDEDDAPADNKIGGSSLFGPSVYAKLTGKKTPGARSSVLGRSALLTAADGSGFQFSPLKRTRRNLDDTLRA